MQRCDEMLHLMPDLRCGFNHPMHAPVRYVGTVKYPTASIGILLFCGGSGNSDDSGCANDVVKASKHLRSSEP